MSIQRTCACGTNAAGECEECRRRQVQRQPRTEARKDSEVPPIVPEVLGTTGRPLGSDLRSEVEEQLGYEFSSVRIHDDSRAAESARAVDALAYTVGPHVVFASGQFRPGTPAGSRLLAHELTHVIQQGGIGVPVSSLRVAGSDASDARLEREAERAADTHGTGVLGNAMEPTLQRLPDPRAAVALAQRQSVLDAYTQRHYSVLEEARRTPMAIQTRDQAADEILWTIEALMTHAEHMRNFLRANFGEGESLRVTSVVKPGEHTKWRKMDVVPEGTTTWEELAAAAVEAGFWVHAEGVTLGGKLWPLSPLATGPHLDLYLINRVTGDFPTTEEGPSGAVAT